MNRKEFIRRAVPEIINDYREVRKTRENSIIFSNGWVASIVEKFSVSREEHKIFSCYV